MSVYIYRYVYIYINTYVDVYIHLYMYIHVYMNIYIYMVPPLPYPISIPVSLLSGAPSLCCQVLSQNLHISSFIVNTATHVYYRMAGINEKPVPRIHIEASEFLTDAGKKLYGAFKNGSRILPEDFDAQVRREQAKASSGEVYLSAVALRKNFFDHDSRSLCASSARQQRDFHRNHVALGFESCLLAGRPLDSVRVFRRSSS